MPSKRKSAPHFPLRTSPRLHPPRLPPQDKTVHSTRQKKAHFTKTESQSTLTQINYVTASSSSYEIQDNEDEEWEERPAKKRYRVRRFDGDERSSKRQSTLTQIDFTKLLTPIDLSEDDVGENEEPCNRMHEGAIRTHLQPMKPKDNVVKEEDLKQHILNPPSIPIGILKTPKKFRGMDVVPSSQSPPDSPLSIQRKWNSGKSTTESLQTLISPIKFRLQRSPLSERPTNISMISQNKHRVEEFNVGTARTITLNAKTKKSDLPQPTFVSSNAKMIVEDSDEEDENIEPTEAEPCLYVGTETQAMLHAIDAACEKYNARNGQKISSQIESGNTEEKNEPALDANANGEQGAAEQLQTGPAIFKNDASEILTQTQENSSVIKVAYVPLGNHDDANSATYQPLGETQTYNEHLLSSRDPEPTCIPSSQDHEQEQEASLPTVQPRSTHHTVRSSQATTIGTSPAPTPHRTQHRHCSSPSKHSVVVVPSSPAPQRTSLPMPRSERGSSPVLSRSAKQIRDLRNQLLEFDYEDDPVSVSQLIPESLVSVSIAMPPPFSSQT